MYSHFPVFRRTSPLVWKNFFFSTIHFKTQLVFLTCMPSPLHSSNLSMECLVSGLFMFKPPELYYKSLEVSYCYCITVNFSLCLLIFALLRCSCIRCIYVNKCCIFFLYGSLYHYTMVLFFFCYRLCLKVYFI